MATHVYANGQEIAAKSADGKSPAAFPDPCWSPPSPPAGPVVIPYPNTTFAKDITNGTATVFICGKEVAIQDRAYFATSTGNEPATQAFAKGLATGAIQGKGYFQSWSFDVIFEGLGVDRHMDMVTHNHGSMPTNSPLFPYLSRGWFNQHDCDDEEKKIKRACKPEKEDSDSKRSLKKGSKLGALLKAKRKDKSGKGRRGKDGWHWTDDHCDGLHISLASAEDAKKYAEELEEAYKSLPDELNILGALESELKEMAFNAGAKALAKWGAKAAVKQLGGSSLPVAGNIAMGIWSAYDAAVAVGDVSEIKAVATESLEKLDILRNKLEDLQTKAKEFADFSKLSDAEKLEKAQALSSDGQDILATLNDCTRARKCNLVPYKADGAGNPFGKRDSKNPSLIESADGGGCCPGQTGHHLIYGAMAEGACPNYDHKVAPTVCVEGTSQNVGSHGRVHDQMDKEVRLLAKGNKLQNETMSTEQAIDAAAKSHKEAFPLSRCSAKCIRAQLEAYYGQMCRGGRLKAVDKYGNPAQSSKGTMED